MQIVGNLCRSLTECMKVGDLCRAVGDVCSIVGSGCRELGTYALNMGLIKNTARN